jgi:NADH:ubiquinone oxidoreductase subunit F (NADH-binding)
MWRAVAMRPGRHVVLVNGAESEPASKKDLQLMLTRPHLVIEGALLAAHATDADEVVIYLHDRHAKASIEGAKRELEAAGAQLPKLKTTVAPARYIAGEQSAAIQWVNGKSALPTMKPPRPDERGINGRPTLVQNVETLANVPLILREGAEWFRSLGSPDLPGTLLVTLNGGVFNPGVYEVPSGITLEQVLMELGGGLTDGIQAVLPGGYFGGWLAPEEVWRGVRLDRESMSAVGAGFGSGAITVVPENVCGLAQAVALLRFFANESARQCGPCTFGTIAMAEVLERVAHGRPQPHDLERLEHYANQMLPRRGACSHLDGATVAARTALDVFQREIDVHRRYGDCGRPTRIVLPGLESEDGR